jgi:hypothetical protein
MQPVENNELRFSCYSNAFKAFSSEKATFKNVTTLLDAKRN